MAVQRFIQRGTSSNATVHRHIAASQKASISVERTTVQHDNIGQSVKRSFVLSVGTLAGVYVDEGEYFYSVVSAKFVGRFCMLVHRADAWLCSSDSPRVTSYCITLVGQRQTRHAA